jgi:Tc5 transposase DNA-binding domain
MPKKKSERIADLDKRVVEALHQLSIGNFKSERAAAKAFNINPSTFNARVKGGDSIAESREPYQLLSIPQETAPVRWITRLTATGHPVRQSFIRKMAQELIYQSRGESSINSQSIDAPSIGESWVQRFLHHHPTGFQEKLVHLTVCSARMTVFLAGLYGRLGPI